MMTIARWMGIAVCALLLCAGCSTGPLGGTKWKILEFDGPDSMEFPDYQKMIVEFRRDGKLITTTTLADGSVDVCNDERYKVDAADKLITIMHPDGQLLAMYRFDDEKLRVHSERFIIVAEPMPEP